VRTALRLLLVAFASLAFPASALAATTAGQAFPSNLYTVEDATQATGLRVDLAKPNCAVRPTDCADIDVLNTLDGFNIQPRISVPFSGPIDLSTVSSSTVFLVGPGFQKVGINQVVWEPAANTLHFESDEQLAQTSTYLLVVTNGVHGLDGEPLDTTTFRHDLNFGQTKDPAVKAYRKSLLDSLSMARAVGVNSDDIATASLFTTQTITAISNKIRAQIQAAAPPRARFDLGTGGERTVFPLSTITAVQWNRQFGTATFSPTFLPVPALNAFGPVISTVAFGSYQSPDYETPEKFIPAYGTATGTPVVQAMNTIGFTLFVPAGAKPAGGWPVAIFGHGFTDSRGGAPWAVASSLASRGLASIAINVVGHGRGPLGTYTILRNSGLPVVLSDGGRAIDQNGDGLYDSTEGVNAAAPKSLIGNRDGLRQTVIDLMQLVRMLQGGLDVDGDSAADLSTSRIYYGGQSFGGIYGVPLLGVEPAVRAGVTNVPGGPIIEIARLSPAFRPLVGFPLATRVPPLYNAVPNATFTNFNENIPLRNEPIRVDTVPGASAIQKLIDDNEWAQQAANPAAYAPYVDPSRILIQFARSDQTVPNPTTSAIIRAGDLQSRTTLYRHDLMVAANPPAFASAKNPHTFLTSLTGPMAPFACAGQMQLATFLASDGAITVDPDAAFPFCGAPASSFETPTSMVPEDLAYIP